ncbi:hypothetical protein POM88_006656 [Heracleum sosnowskyi]|uniref:MULE transposase domain-containing protein n=1 Tax=Heracleum sosnowskyi TaxID=360622 RepID=A0AAD8J587_9APIA|nr:hypothetical protein POM88_006656 [Heracleum sosnowskyi]
MVSSSNQAQNFDCAVDIESSSGNILNNQNNVFIESVCDSTETSVIENFVDVFDDSFSRTTNIWKPKVSDPNLKPYSGQWFKDIESCFQFYTQYGLQGGFNVRKSTQKVKNKKIVTKYIGLYSDAGPTAVDFQNWMRDIKLYIGKHDADMLLQKFRDKHDTSDGGFCYEYQTDSDGCLTRIFWADVRGRKNYDVFGDVVSFDATYRTNKHGMVFVPFIGVNNHWKSVTFGSALLEHENETHFTWACEMFLKVFCRPQKCIITDQCLAMKVAIQKTFPDSIHRYCMWHIMQKFLAKIGHVFCAESSFMEKLNKFVWSSHLTVAKFEEGWNAMLNEFGLSNHVWLNEIYGLWGVERIPNQFLSRHWLRNAEERFCTLKFPDNLQGSNGHIVKDTSKKILTEFQNCYGKVSNHIEGLNFMLEEMKCLNIRIQQKFNKSAVTKDDMLEEHFGVRPSGASSVLPPLQSNNKGSRKRILGPPEISCDGKKRKMKNCRNCKELVFRDSRNCPLKGTQLQQNSLVENVQNTLNQEMESQSVDGQNVHAIGTLNSNIEIQTVQETSKPEGEVNEKIGEKTKAERVEAEGQEPKPEDEYAHTWAEMDEALLDHRKEVVRKDLADRV